MSDYIKKIASELTLNEEDLNENEMVLISEKESEVKCGQCGNNLLVRVYYHNDKYYTMFYCKTCNIKMWKH